MRKGSKHSEESKYKQSESRKRFYLGGGIHPRGMLGKLVSEITREKKSKLMQGFHPVSEFQIGHIVAADTRRKISESRKGMKFSDETKMRIGASSKGRKWTEETRIKQSELRKGEKSHLWRGGITPINNKIRQSLEYKLWRSLVFKRDSYKCVFGGETHGNRIEADHIKPFAFYPELRFDLDNGRTLCKDCHKNTATYGGRIRQI